MPAAKIDAGLRRTIKRYTVREDGRQVLDFLVDVKVEQRANSED